MNENNRPVKDYVPQPYRRTVSAPNIKTAYDYNSLASTYLHIDGFEKGNKHFDCYLYLNATLFFITLAAYIFGIAYAKCCLFSGLNLLYKRTGPLGATLIRLNFLFLFQFSKDRAFF